MKKIKIWRMCVVVSLFVMANMIVAWFIIWNNIEWIKWVFLSMNIMMLWLVQFILILTKYIH